MNLGDIPASTLNYLMAYYSQWIGFPAGTLQAIAQKESSYDPSSGFWLNACSSAGACGLMALKPIMVQDIYNNFRVNIDRMDPVQSIVAAALGLWLTLYYMWRVSGEPPSLEGIIVGYNGGYKAGLYYEQTGRAPSNEGANYLAFVGSRIGIV